MTTEPTAPTSPARSPRLLSKPAYFGLMFGVCLVMATLAALAKEFGGQLGGDRGVIAGLAVGFVLVCAICAALPRLFANPTLPLLSSLFVGMAAGGVAEAAGLDDRETWRWIARYTIFFGVYLLWATLVVPVIVRRPSAPSAAP